MKFNYFKGLINSVLFCSLYVKAKKFENGCSDFIGIAYKCEEDKNRNVLELKINYKNDIEKGVFAGLKSLKKLDVHSYNYKLDQYHFDEIATLPNLEELKLGTFYGDNKLNMNVFKNLTNLSTLELFQYEDEINLNGFKNLKK
eukprot:jgi/Orpsp1_1/1189580/evm.model.d7180000073025.1